MPEQQDGDAEKLTKMRQAYNSFYENSESFYAGGLGTVLAYLLGSILKDGVNRYYLPPSDEEEPGVRFLLATFGDTHWVWRYVKFADEHDLNVPPARVREMFPEGD